MSRDLGEPGATFSIEPARSIISTSALRVSIQHAPFRVAFATRAGQSLDEDDPQRGTALSGAASRVWKRLRDDEHVYALGQKNGPLDKRGWKLGGYSFTMWNSDTFEYDASTDPLYVSVPFYMVLRKGVAYGIFLDNTFRSNFDIGHQVEGLLSFGAEGGALDYYFIYGPEPKKVIERYTALTGRMPLPPLWSLGYHQCRYSYYPENVIPNEAKRSAGSSDSPFNVTLLCKKKLSSSDKYALRPPRGDKRPWRHHVERPIRRSLAEPGPERESASRRAPLRYASLLMTQALERRSGSVSSRALTSRLRRSSGQAARGICGVRAAQKPRAFSKRDLAGERDGQSLASPDPDRSRNPSTPGSSTR